MAGTHFLRNFPVWKTLQVVVSSVTHRWTLCQNRSSGRLGGNLRTTIFNRSFCCGWERCFSFSFLALAAFEGVEVATADITSLFKLTVTRRHQVNGDASNSHSIVKCILIIYSPSVGEATTEDHSSYQPVVIRRPYYSDLQQKNEPKFASQLFWPISWDKFQPRDKLKSMVTFCS